MESRSLGQHEQTHAKSICSFCLKFYWKRTIEFKWGCRRNQSKENTKTIIFWTVEIIGQHVELWIKPQIVIGEYISFADSGLYWVPSWLTSISKFVHFLHSQQNSQIMLLLLLYKLWHLRWICAFIKSVWVLLKIQAFSREVLWEEGPSSFNDIKRNPLEFQPIRKQCG